MKAVKKQKPTRRKILTLGLMFAIPFLLATQANAHQFNFWENSDGYTYSRVIPVVVAACTTMTPYYPVPLPTYVCCKLKNDRHSYAWRNTWVSGTCKAADVHARYDWGCDMNSPVYGTNAPILGYCQITSRTIM